MRIGLGADHAGFELKESLKTWLRNNDYGIKDLGAFNCEPTDYPIYAQLVGEAVSNGEVDLGVLVCGTGIGVSIAANKVTGVRAAVVHDSTSAKLAREHNDANIICFGARLIGNEVALDSLATFLSSQFQGGRHERRILEISQIEKGERI